MAYHQPRQTDQHVSQFYDMIIDRVVEDLTPKLEDEGIDTSVLLGIKQVKSRRFTSRSLACYFF